MNGGSSFFVGGPVFNRPFMAAGLSEIEQLKQTVKFLDDRVRQLSKSSGPTQAAMVYRIDDEKEVTLQLPNGQMIIADHPRIPLKPGQIVRCIAQSGAIIGNIDIDFIGPVAEVQQVIGRDLVEIEHGGQRRVTRLVGIEAERGDRIVLNPDTSFGFRNIGRAKDDASGPIGTVRQLVGKSLEVELQQGRCVVRAGKNLPEVKPGDRVVLDKAGAVAVELLPREEDGLAFKGETGVTWDDVKGQAEAVRALREAIEEPWREKDVYALFDQPQSKGVLLSGPPGTGKTLIARAAASALAELHGKKASGTGYAYVAGPEIMEKWIGSSEGNVRRIFRNAEAHFKEHGYPQLVAIDEAESVLMARTRRESHGGNADVAITQAFLACMDGLTASCAFILLLTNRPQDIDPAVLRDGRISVTVQMKRPDATRSIDVLQHHLGAKKPLEFERQEMAAKVAALVFDQRHVLATVKTAADRHRFTLGHCATGALLEGIVRKATQLAIRRCISEKDSPRKVLLTDFEGAVEQAVREAQQKGFAEAIAEFIATRPDNASATWLPASVKEESKILRGR